MALLHREGKTASSYLQELYDRYVVYRALPLTLAAYLLAVTTVDTVTSKSVSLSAKINITSSVRFQTNNSYYICNDPLVIDQIFARLRNYDRQVCLHLRCFNSLFAWKVENFIRGV